MLADAHRIEQRQHVQYFQRDNESSNQRLAAAGMNCSSDKLCGRCQSLDFQEVLQREIEEVEGSLVMYFNSSAETLKASDCPLCQLFGAMSPSDLDHENFRREEHCHLRAFSANDVFAGFFKSDIIGLHDKNVLGVIRMRLDEGIRHDQMVYVDMLYSLRENGCLCPLQPSKSPASIVDVQLLSRESWNLKFVANCLAYCIENHNEACNEVVAPFTSSLRVIDCETRRVIKAPLRCQYVALSYVWGQSASTTSTTALENTPKLIDDSIEVTLNLKLRYLWVDKYCIDQSNELDRHDQIRQMDSIYARAHLTIIAAAGENPDHGLPGVRGTLRALQPQIKISDHRLVSTLPSPKFTVKNSKWATRGWTYQEGVFSKRRLFFTNEQVFYHCNEMQGIESLALPINVMHEKAKMVFYDNIPGYNSYDGNPGTRPWDIMGYVSEFNQRKLKYPEDTFNAMYGIFNSFSRSPRPVHQILGVAIPPPITSTERILEAIDTSRTAEECFVIGLSWSHLSPSKRRALFPTWTWAGWHGKLGYRFMVNAESKARLQEVNVWIEEKDGSLSRFPDWDSLSKFLSRDFRSLKFLHLEAYMLAFSIVHLRRDTVLAERNADWAKGGVGFANSYPPRSRDFENHIMKEDGHFVEFEIGPDVFLYIRIKLDEDVGNVQFAEAGLTQRTKPEMVGISLDGSLADKRDPFNCINTILIAQKRDSHYERFGICNLAKYSALRRYKGIWEHVEDVRIDVVWPISKMGWMRRTIRLG